LSNPFHRDICKFAYSFFDDGIILFWSWFETIIKTKSDISKESQNIFIKSWMNITDKAYNFFMQVIDTSGRIKKSIR
jgi:hypothetical protein